MRTKEIESESEILKDYEAQFCIEAIYRTYQPMFYLAPMAQFLQKNQLESQDPTL